MNEYDNRTPEQAQEAHDYLLTLGKFTVAFASVNRALHYPNNDPENDAEHSFHLALSAVELAATYYPELDVGLVAQFSVVHDLPEIYAGDVPSYNLTPDQRAEKAATEAGATTRLLSELPPHTAQLLERYEQQLEPEARFVRFVDKLLPPIIHAVAADANRKVFKDAYKLKSIEDELENRKETMKYLQELFPEFPFIHVVRDLLSATSSSRIFSADK